jgi:uncharacterized NAD-dependent epimerase/dehydratase family protein
MRRLVILVEGQFAAHDAKTAIGVIRYGPDPVVAVLDSTRAGGNVRQLLGDDPRFDIPIVATLDEALRQPEPPTALLIGIAPTGGRLPASWRATIFRAIEAGLDVLSGATRSSATTPSSRPLPPRSGSSTTGGRPSGWRPPSAGATYRASG